MKRQPNSMNDLSQSGKYEITGQMKEEMETFAAGYASEGRDCQDD